MIKRSIGDGSFVWTAVSATAAEVLPVGRCSDSLTSSDGAFLLLPISAAVLIYFIGLVRHLWRAHIV